MKKINKLMLRSGCFLISFILIFGLFFDYRVYAEEEIIEEIDSGESIDSNIENAEEIDVAKAGGFSTHEHECTYTSTNDGYHIIKCTDRECDYEEIEECNFIADNSDGNLKVCSRCRGTQRLYMLKSGKAVDLKLYDGSTGHLYFGMEYLDRKYSDFEMVFCDDNKYDGEYSGKGFSQIDQLSLKANNSVAGHIGTRVFDNDGMYNDTGEKFQTEVIGQSGKNPIVYLPVYGDLYSPLFGFSNLLNKNAYGYNIYYNSKFVDLKNYDTVVFEYTARNNNYYRTSFCNASPYKTEVENIAGVGYRKYHVRQYYDISSFSKGINSMPYPSGTFDIFGVSTISLWAEDIDLYAINQGGDAGNYSFNAKLDSEIADANVNYNDVASFRITGSNFCNSKWYYIPKDGEEPIFVTGKEDFVVNQSEYATESVLCIKANKDTDSMSFFFKTKGYDDTEYIESNIATLKIINDPAFGVKITGLNMPKAGEALDDLADVEILTYKGNSIKQKASIEWFASECLNPEKPNVEALKLASYNTKYGYRIAINTFSNTETPFLDGEFYIECNDNRIDDESITISENGLCIEVEGVSNEFSAKYPVGELKDIKAEVILDNESELFFDLEQIIEITGAKIDKNYISRLVSEYTVTNQNRFVLDDKEILNKNIKLSGMATRPGTVYEASFKLESNLYEDAVFSLVVVSKEEGIKGRYIDLLSPGVYRLENNENVKNWNDLLNDDALDCSGSILYELADKYFERNEYLVLSRKITKIRKDAFADSNLSVVQFSNTINQIGANALSGIEEVYYEGSIKEWEALMEKSAKPISKDNFTVHFIDYKKPVICFDTKDLIYDGKEKKLDNIEVYVSDNLNYTYNVSLGRLLDEKSSAVYKIDPKDYEVSYKNNIDAGMATVLVNAKDGAYSESADYEIKKAPIVHFDDTDYYKEVKTFTQFLEKFYLYDQLPSDAGSCSFTKKLLDKSDQINEEINAKGLVSLSGFSYNTGSLYKAEYVISSKNYEDISFVLELVGSSISDELYAEYRGKKYTFEEALSVGLINVNEKGYITFISQSLYDSLSIPDYVDTKNYKGYINGFENIQINSHGLELIAMDKNMHIKELPDCLFEDNSIIECIILPNGLSRIGASCFAKCPELRLVYIPESVESIGQAAFLNDYSLYPNSDKNYSVKLPEGRLNTIEDNVFFGCKNLSSIDKPFVIPANIVTIVGNAFNSVEYLCYEGSKVTMEDMIFDNLSLKQKNMFNYRGQKISYPYNLKEIELVGENPGNYIYENEPNRPAFLVWTNAGYYYSYELEGESLSANEIVADENDFEYLCGGRGYNTVYKDNNHVGQAKLIVSAAGKYHGNLEKSFVISKGNLANYINSNVEVNLFSLNAQGKQSVVCNKNVYAKDIEFGRIEALEFSNIKMDADSEYEINSNGNVNLHLVYDILEEMIDRPQNIFAADCLIRSENFNDYSFKIKYNISAAKFEIDKAVYNGKPQTPAVKVWFNKILAVPDIDYSCTYYNNVDKGTGRVLVKGIGRVLEEKELPFEIQNGDASNSIKDTLDNENNIKNAEVLFEYDKDGTLVYKVEEKVGCLIDLCGDEYRIGDYLPSDMGKVNYTILNLEADESEISVSKAVDDLIAIEGYCEYPTSKLLNATYGVLSSNYGFFKVDFSVSSIRPITTYAKKVVNTNVGLFDEALNLSDNMSDKVIAASIKKVYSGGCYDEFVKLKENKLSLGEMIQDSGRIFYGSYAGRDEDYQSYRINVNIDAQNPNVSTKDVVCRQLKEGFSAKYVEGYLYDGKAIKPVVDIYDVSGNKLNYKKDYVLKYINNKDANISPFDAVDNVRNKDRLPIIIIKFKGKYKEIADEVLPFYILQRDLSTFEIVYGNDKTLIKNAPLYNDKVIKKLLDTKKRTVKKKDYIVSYVNPHADGDGTKEISKPYAAKSDNSRYEIVITGKNNYCGQLKGEFCIK